MIQDFFVLLDFFHAPNHDVTPFNGQPVYRVSHFRWAPRITSKEVIFKENDLDKNCCTQREISIRDHEIVLQDLPQSYSKVKVFFKMKLPNFDDGNR